jgi:hypothetical protein
MNQNQTRQQANRRRAWFHQGVAYGPHRADAVRAMLSSGLADPPNTIHPDDESGATGMVSSVGSIQLSPEAS